jgi:hypothetical protein
MGLSNTYFFLRLLLKKNFLRKLQQKGKREGEEDIAFQHSPPLSPLLKTIWLVISSELIGGIKTRSID